MRINNNIMAINAHRQLMANQTGASKAIERLSSGLRINRAGDDAAGLAISEKMRGQVRGLTQAMRNAQDAISLIQTAEGALNETQAILQRMRELAVQSANDTNTDSDRAELQKEVDQLAIELTRIANNTEFNTQTLLNGAIQNGAIGELGFHIGANDGQFITLAIGAMDAATLGVSRDVLAANLAPGAEDITGASLEGQLGQAIKAGASIDVSVTENTGVTASGTLDIGGDLLTIEGANKGAALNGITIAFGADNDDAVTATWDSNSNTLTIAADWDDSAAAGAGGAPTLADIEAAIQAALEDGGAGPGLADGEVSITFGGDIADLAGAGSVTLSGGADANADERIVTLDDGTNTQSVIVNHDATTVRVTTGDFQGLVITTDALVDTQTAAKINIVEDQATAATFQNGQKVDDAYTGGGIDVSSRTSADSAITIIQNAIDRVSTERSKLGAYQNRLEHTIANLGVSAENLQAAESRIRDVDMAAEMMAFTKFQILQQASTAMLAQANLAPQSVLQLLG